MVITLAFQQDEEGGYTLISAYDDYTYDIWNGVPDFHKQALKAMEDNGAIREARVSIWDSAVEKLFQAPEIEMKNWQEGGD